jgi:hypothetical protein
MKIENLKDLENGMCEANIELEDEELKKILNIFVHKNLTASSQDNYHSMLRNGLEIKEAFVFSCVNDVLLEALGLYIKENKSNE